MDVQQASTMNHEAGHYEELDLFLSRTKELRNPVKFFKSVKPQAFSKKVDSYLAGFKHF
jgi:hypothetical protein